MNQPILTGEGLYKLIPQRPPIVMVDTFYEADATSATTGLTILTNNARSCINRSINASVVILFLHSKVMISLMIIVYLYFIVNEHPFTLADKVNLACGVVVFNKLTIL